jgi:hypothetical protein
MTWRPSLHGRWTPDHARQEPSETAAVFKLTPNNLNEGGRKRGGEAYLNVNRARFGFFGCYEFDAVTDNGMRFLVRLSGSSSAAADQVPKNLRSVPSRALGSWLLIHHRAQPGDEVHVSRHPGTGFLFTFIRRMPRW